MTFVGSGRKISYQLAAKNVTHRQNPEYFEIPGTIAVYIAPNAYSGHVSVVVGSYDRQDNGHDPVTEQSAILKNTTDYVASQIEKTYGIPASKMTGISSITGHTSIWLHSETMGTDMKKIDGTPSGTYNPVWRIEAYSDDYGVCVTNAITGTAGNQVARYVFVPYVEKTTPAPTITSAKVSNVSSDGYTVTVTFDAQEGVSSLQLPTWTEKNGQDDLVWHNASVSGNTATFHVNVSQHGWESGKYITHIYVKSKNGESKPVPVYVTVPAASSKKYIHNGVDYSAVFDPVYYLGHYQDLRNAFGNNYDLAFKHFISNGMKEARIAKESFNVVNYRNRYVDLRNAFGSNWAAYYTHYISYGIKENRNSN